MLQRPELKKVLLFQRCPAISCYTSAGIPAPTCGLYPWCPRQKGGPLWRKFHINAQSGQCGNTTSPSFDREVLSSPGCTRPPARSFVWCGGASGSWWSRGLTGPGACMPLPWRVSPGLWQSGPALSWCSVENFLGLLTTDGWGSEIGPLVRWGQELLGWDLGKETGRRRWGGRCCVLSRPARSWLGVPLRCMSSEIGGVEVEVTT